MPLRTDHSRDATSYDIRELIGAGHPQKQAEAIALKSTGFSRNLDKLRKKPEEKKQNY